MDKRELLEKFDSFRTWKRRDQRAPHKPLLILLGIRDIEAGKSQYRSFSEIEKPLISLLKEFGPVRSQYKPQYPFWRLKKDEIWDLPNKNLLDDIEKDDQGIWELRAKGIQGGFVDDVYHLLKSDSSLRSKIVSNILHEHFPESYHQNILDAIGLSRKTTLYERSTRDADFRKRVIEAYDYQCAVCGFDLRLNDLPVGLEAAHVKWHNHGGPDDVTNGICLCSLHHSLFDRGVFRIGKDYRLYLSSWISNYGSSIEKIRKLNLMQIQEPRHESWKVSEDFLEWNASEVFKQPNLKF